MLKHRPDQNHYDFELEAGIAKHCLGVKIVDIGMIKSKSYFQEKVPYQIARAHVHDAPTACVIYRRITIMELDRCINFHVGSSKYLEIRGPQRGRALHVHLHHNTSNPAPSNSTR